MARRIVSARDQVEMLSPWRRRTAAPSMQWYHTSPYKLPVGTELTPGGGQSHYDHYYRALGEPDRKNHVWVEHRPDLLKRWHDIDADTNYHYRVEPVGGNPRPYKDGDYSQGWVVPRARIVEDLGPAKRRRKGHTAALHPLPQHGVNINDTLQDFTGQILRGEKTIETRNTNSLRPIIGHHVAIIRNHLRQPSGLLVGYATIGEPKIYTSTDDFDADFSLHQIASGSAFHIDHPNCKYGVKYGYPLHDVQAEPNPYRIVGPGQPYRYRMKPRMAMPAVDAYDNRVSPWNRSNDQQIHPGPWYHASDHDLPDGTMLVPGGGSSQWRDEDFYGKDNANRQNWVWMNHNPHQTRVWGNHLYQVEPLDEGPWEWNGGGQLFTDGYVAPRARIIRKVHPDELKVDL